VKIAQHPSINRLLAGSPSIAFFRNVPDEKTVAHLSGKGWTEDEVVVEHGRAARPLRTAPTSSVTVRWSVQPELATANSCASAPARQTSPPAITFSRSGSIVRTVALDRAATRGEIEV
jgi:hypothetical protein